MGALARADICQVPPRAAAPTSDLDAQTSAPTASSSAATKVSPTFPDAVSQLHSRSSPSAASARPIAERSSAESPSVPTDHSPAAKPTRPGAPCAMTCTASSPACPASAAEICRAAGWRSSSTTARTSGLRLPRTVTRSEIEESTKRISEARAMTGSCWLRIQFKGKPPIGWPASGRKKDIWAARSSSRRADGAVRPFDSGALYAEEATGLEIAAIVERANRK